ncbi:oligosaccharide flippase family protein [Streptomyces sp. NPDC002812]|uniref:oligosaccharide flippase family protein n=1 Tax=unclassified Streptomyces TaxID=2593676 RepID=UPI00202E2F3E|nr:MULTISPECIES: oligosaccharide flippase family protein [unclassified Streptomyces]MCM1972148.1 oligosaccharide flippase family protein [Streptomyces sp. G1]MCX5129579.1 oligosaccharide flippase family protein [Streptomyces sp. NBC_00347]
MTAPTTDTGTQDPSGAPPGAPDEAPSLGRKVGSAARWSLVNTMVMRLGNFAMGIVLARFFLGPEAWGVYGIAQTVLLVLLSANELGVSLAIVRWEGDPRRFAPTVLTLSAASSLLLYAALFALAPAVAGVLGSPEASGVLRVMCVVVVLDGLSQVPAGFLTRAFAQGRRMAVDAVNFVLSTAVTLLLAAQGWGAMSFAWGAVAGSAGALVGCCLAAPGTLRFGWDREQARALLGFGLPLAGASLLALGVANVPPMVVGSNLDQLALGFYVLAFNISGWPVRIVSEAARRVSFAGFSRLAESPKALADGFGRALGVLVTVTVPLCVLLGGLAGPIVVLVYGERWEPAARALPWLMALGLIRIGCELAYDCLVAIGRRRSLIAVQGLWLLLLVPVLVAGARTGGIAGVAQGQVLVAGAVVVPVYLVALHRGGVRLGIVARACAWPLLGGAVMAGAVLGLERLLGDGVLALLATAAAATLCYAVCVLPSFGFLRGTASAAAATTTKD